MPVEKIVMCKKEGDQVIKFGYMGSSYFNINYAVTSSNSLDSLANVNYNQHLDNLLKTWNDAFEENSKIHAENLPKIAAMKEEIEEIKTFMKSKGLEPTYYTADVKSRKAIKPTISVQSGYMQDIARVYKLQDGFEQFVQKFEALKKKVEEIRRLCNNIRAKAEREKEEKKKNDRNFIKLIELNKELGSPVKDMAGMDVNEIANELLDVVLEKNNLLNLAHAMLKTRGDWNDGCDRVSYALFKPNNEKEEEIVEAVSKAVDDFDECQDGRVFRDCEWSYSEIFAEVAKTDENLFKLYEQISEMAGDM